MHSEFLRIPSERIAALIGKKGETKKSIEKKTGCRINVDSSSGEIEISCREGKDLNLYRALNIAKAIGRGFSPERALFLLDDEYLLEIIDLPEITGKSSRAMDAKRGRVIGRAGRAREEIEKDTESFLSVYGKTVSIIGKPENVEKAMRAVQMLLGGAEHKSVFDYLKREEKEKFEL